MSPGELSYFVSVSDVFCVLGCDRTMEMPGSPRRQKVTHTHTFPQRVYEKICDTDGDAKSIAGALCAEAEQRHSQLWENAFVLCCAEMSASGQRDRYGRTMSSINPEHFPSLRPQQRSPAARHADN